MRFVGVCEQWLDSSFWEEPGFSASGSLYYIRWVFIDVYLEIANGDEEFLMIWKCWPAPVAFDGKSWLKPDKMSVSH